jgi:hypothetical protein
VVAGRLVRVGGTAGGEVGAIRPHLLLRVAAWVMFAAWILVGGALTLGVGSAFFPLGLVPLAFTVVGAVFWVRAARLAAVPSNDAMVVRNLTRSVRLSKEAIAAVEIGRSRIAWRSWYRTVVIVLGDGARVDVDVCARYVDLRRQRRLLERDLARLQAWLAG